MPNQNQWSVFKRLLTYLKPYKFLTFLALAFLLSTTVIKSIIPLVASYFIDHYLHDMNQAASLILIGYYGLYLLQTLVQYLG
ncbi:MAG: ABC transporter ATP-binding protein, partial [Streptococcus sp.]